MSDNINPLQNSDVKEYVLNDYCKGYSQLVDNCWNYSIFAQDPSVDIFKNELYAGFVQAKIQGKAAIKAARDNVWRNFLICYTPQDNIYLDLTDQALKVSLDSCINNYTYLYQWLKKHEGEKVATHIKRVLLRMAGIWAGVNNDQFPDGLCFDALDPARFEPSQMKLGGYDAQEITFMDIYFLNAEMDMYDVISDKIGISYGAAFKKKPDHCTAFVKYMDDGEIYISHNTWFGFFSQTCAVSYAIGEDFASVNAISQGVIASNTDFGFNKNGLLFNETTHAYLKNEPKELGIWLTWRAAAAEMFATSIEDFYEHICIDNTATFQNGYMLVDINKGEIGLVEMSYNRVYLFKSDGKSLTQIDSTGYKPTEKDYDSHLISPTHIFGVNYPISKPVCYELETLDTRPMRRNQLYNKIDSVVDDESCRALITYTEDDEPLSIYGRWDLGYGTTEFHRIRPDGSVDAKMVSSSMVKKLLSELTFKPNKDSKKTSFWMKYGTPTIPFKPFVWSESRFKQFKQSQDIDYVPDVLDGKWNPVRLFMD